MPDLTWQKSSYSGHGNCLEVAHTGRFVLIRDSKHPQGSVLIVKPEAWQAFLADVKAGDFDERENE